MQRCASFGLALALALLVGCETAPSTTASGSTSPAPQAQTVPAEALNPDVRQDTIQQTICVPGYTASVRPSTSYTNGIKLKLLRERGLPATEASAMELDHRVPLALGGHPRNLLNLRLQRWEGDDGAKKKDALERKLQREVCAGRVKLEAAQRQMYFDWRSARDPSEKR
jgi:hypothetical protein